MPSVLESFGNVWAEAMASGLPVVGSTLTCGPEVAPDGIAGVFAAPNLPESISRAVETLMQDPGPPQAPGKAGRRTAPERYSTDLLIPATLEFYLRWLSRY